MKEFNDENAPHQVLFEALGVVCRVCASSADLLQAIQPLLPPSRTESTALLESHPFAVIEEDDGSFSVYNAGTRVNDGGSRDLALIVIEGQVRSYISLHAPNLTFIHAGTVGYEGRAMIVPGHSFAGKTTLTAALVRAGASYYSDEFAVLDADGLVHPYAKTLSLRPEGLQVEHSVEELGGVAGDTPLPLGLVVSTYYEPGASWKPTRLTGGAALLEVLSNTVTMTTRPEEAIRTVTRAMRGVTMLKGERGQADELAPQLLAELVQHVTG